MTRPIAYRWRQQRMISCHSMIFEWILHARYLEPLVPSEFDYQNYPKHKIGRFDQEHLCLCHKISVWIWSSWWYQSAPANKYSYRPAVPVALHYSFRLRKSGPFRWGNRCGMCRRILVVCVGWNLWVERLLVYILFGWRSQFLVSLDHFCHMNRLHHLLRGNRCGGHRRRFLLFWKPYPSTKTELTQAHMMPKSSLRWLHILTLPIHKLDDWDPKQLKNVFHIEYFWL